MSDISHTHPESQMTPTLTTTPNTAAGLSGVAGGTGVTGNATGDPIGAGARQTKISPFVSIPALYRLFVRGQMTRFRLIAMVALGAIAVVLAFTSRSAFDSTGVFLESFIEFTIGILIPLLALLMATPMLGNLIEDRLMAYLVIKPIPRWHIALAALLAATSVLTLVVLAAVVTSVIVAGEMSFIGVSVLASALATLAYSAIFMLMGLVTKSGQWVGLVYLFLWETSIARLSEGTARLSIRSYVTSIIGWVTERELPLDGRAEWASVVIPLAVAVVALFATARVLARRDID